MRGRTMTHDELIAYIDDSTDGLKHEHLFEKLLANTTALRSVVGLHRPIIHALPDETCWACQDLYPCPTIQAITKELK
jgi:hypothetical protein